MGNIYRYIILHILASGVHTQDRVAADSCAERTIADFRATLTNLRTTYREKAETLFLLLVRPFPGVQQPARGCLRVESLVPMSAQLP